MIDADNVILTWILIRMAMNEKCVKSGYSIFFSMMNKKLLSLVRILHL